MEGQALEQVQKKMWRIKVLEILKDVMSTGQYGRRKTLVLFTEVLTS